MISIVIRAMNERQYLAEVLRAILAQDDKEEFEVLLIDSGSTDGTLSIARNFPVRLVEIPANKFSFGYALNLGVKLARGRIIVNLSAHCTPLTHEWLRYLVEPLRTNPILVATYGRQEPRKGVNPFEENGMQDRFPANGRPPVAIFSNANCAIWREVAQRKPFDECLTFSEDLVWRLQFRLDQVLYVPQAGVYHSHPFNFRYWARRFEQDGIATVSMKQAYGIKNPYTRTRGSLRETARDFLGGCRGQFFFCASRGYFRFLPLAPIFEGTRIFFHCRGLRKGEAMVRGTATV